MDKVIVATGNMGKLREIREIFTGFPFELESLKEHFGTVPEILEDGNTFFENARKKAMWVFEKTGIASLADDSGLEVDCLNGLPGVKSARYAGEPSNDKKNMEKLLKACADVPPEKRTARFKCVIVFIVSLDVSYVCEGVCEGRIGFIPKGTDGFGYDPLFIPKGYSETFAEIGSNVKNSISHRAQALHALKRTIHDRYHS
jgi:XTP/dITP diphosphohydrolase